MLRLIVCVSALVAVSLAQSCSVSLLPQISGRCPDQFTIQGTGCCPNANVINACCDKLNPVTKVSDCPSNAALCQNSAYRQFMKDECPKTCGYCTGTPSCVDKINPNTGRSDCPGMAAYCKDSRYATLMRDECPKTCAFC